jgi:hypothetical protein
MGANAQTAVPVFTVGQVLTAAQMTQVNTGIPVFATTVTRDAAFNGAGEKVLAQGQYCYLESTSTLQVYTGSAWITAGSSGLNLISAASFTSQTTVSLSNSTFTSTYQNYIVYYQVQAVSSTLTMRMRTSGTDNSGASYIGGATGYNNQAVRTDIANNNSTAWTLGYGFDSLAGSTGYAINLYRPQLAQYTNFTFEGTSSAAAYSGQGIMSGGGIFNGTTQFDALSIISSVASSQTGTYRVYGLADA